MRHLKTAIHPKVQEKKLKTKFSRYASRAIALQGELALMLYTERYNDYSFPGGGLEDGEDSIKGMVRELVEETGAKDIKNIQAFGIYEEYRPWYKDDYDVQHMISYCFTCSVSKELGATSYEKYEINNGMKPVWVHIDEAIEHNLKTILENKKSGMSVERETFLLKLVRKELIFP